MDLEPVFSQKLFLAGKDSILRRFFLLPFIVLLILFILSSSGTALAAHTQQRVSTRQIVHMQQLHMGAQRVSALRLFPAITCSGQGCTGQDPVATGCSASASTILSGGIFNNSGQRIGTINLRYSSVCQTNWAQTVSSIGSTPIQALVSRESGADGSGIIECEPTNCSSFVTATSVFTDMVWAPDVPALAAGEIVQGNGTFIGCVTQDPRGLPCGI